MWRGPQSFLKLVECHKNVRKCLGFVSILGHERGQSSNNHLGSVGCMIHLLVMQSMKSASGCLSAGLTGISLNALLISTLANRVSGPNYTMASVASSTVI